LTSHGSAKPLTFERNSPQEKEHDLPYSTRLPTSHVTPLVVLIDNVYFFPVSWRKFCLSACRIQCPCGPTHTSKKKHRTSSRSLSCFRCTPLLRRISATYSAELEDIIYLRNWYDMVSYYKPDIRQGLAEVMDMASTVYIKEMQFSYFYASMVVPTMLMSPAGRNAVTCPLTGYKGVVSPSGRFMCKAFEYLRSP
jgi:hypothetical protein